MEWFPVVFVTFKVLVLGTGMYYAVKWHYDQGKKDQDARKERRAVLRGAAKAVAIFAVALLVLSLVTYFVVSKLSLDLSMP